MKKEDKNEKLIEKYGEIARKILKIAKEEKGNLIKHKEEEISNLSEKKD